MDGEQIIPFTSPTTRPGEPVTSGVDVGDGPGSAALQVLDQRLNFVTALEQDGSPEALMLRDLAMRRGWI